MKLWAFIAVILVSPISAPCAEPFGQFEGKLVTEWDKDGRTMILTKPFAYISPTETRWEAPIGSRVDGASIPQFAWSLIGGPFEGQYRNASVIHDVACDVQDRPWQDVHEAFYTAMRAGGVGPVKAKIMFAAVYHFGPRWPQTIVLKDVPLDQVDQRVASVSVGVDKDGGRLVDVRPEPTQVWGWDTSPEAQQKLADVTVVFTPPPADITMEDFERLKADIETRDIPIDQIRDYKSTTIVE